MPARISRSNVGSASQKKGAPKNKSKKRSLNAFAQAQKLVPEERIPRHRLGEVENDGDGPRQKRRRDDEEEEDDEDEEGEPQRKRPARRQDGELEYGSDSDGNEWTLGGLAEDGEDSDLDSDEAFGESDEEKFEGFTFRGSSKPKSRKKARARHGDHDSDIDLDEEQESVDDSGDSQDEEGLGLGDDAVDLAAMLDDNSENEQEAVNGEGESGSSDGEDESDEEEDDDFEEFEDDENDEEGAARLQDFLEGLDDKLGTKQKEAPQRSIATLDDFADGTEFAAERSKLKKKHQPKALAAPLPKRQQDRINREIAAQKAKEQLDRWRDTVIQNRRAEHLQFPLQHPDDQGITLGKERFLPAAQQAPANELEESIQRIMQESGLQTKQSGQTDADDEEDLEAAILKAEGLAEKHLPVEEVERRRADLRRARDLLFREEIKAKRIAKIKSKGYRRVRRKENERKAEKERETLRGLGFEDEDEKEKHDRKRAEARMSTKHKDSKWAKSLKQTSRSAWDDDARDGVIEQARRNEELKKRMAGQDVSDDDGSLPSDESDDDDDVNEQKLEALKVDSGERKGLAGLKFMRAAEERKRKQNDETIELLRKDLAAADGEEESGVEEDESLGRAIFGPAGKKLRQKAKEKKHEFEAPDDSDAEDRAEDDGSDAEPTIAAEKTLAKTKSATNGILKKTNTASGPLAKSWMTEPSAEKESSGASDWFKKSKNPSKNKAEVDAEVIMKPEAPSRKPEKPSHGPVPTDSAAAGDTTGWTTVSYQNGDAASDSDKEDIYNAMTATQTLQQRAFAGDEVVSAFQSEKAELALSEDEKEISNHLPGWGSWTGDGLSKTIRKANKRAAHNPLHKTKLDGVKQADRKDAKLNNVIISEKQDRKGKKYFAPQLPHGFETKEQYERSRRLPMGPEWTTKEVHQKMVKPRVIVKPGVRMEALERPTV